jgi:hypothetical protein
MSKLSRKYTLFLDGIDLRRCLAQEFWESFATIVAENACVE